MGGKWHARLRQPIGTLLSPAVDTGGEPELSQGPYRFIKGILGGHHFIVDLTLPYGRVLYDYLREGE